MFSNLKNMVEKHDKDIIELKKYEDVNEKNQKKQDKRIDDLESGFDFLKKMGASEGGDNSGLLDEIQKMKESLRSEFGEKVSD